MLRTAERNEFDAIYSLLLESFPADELRPYDAQQALFSDPHYTAYVTDGLSAVITVWQFETFAFIEHFAVSPACRNQGLGAGILQEMLQMLSVPLVLEAELPETELAKRRLAFYQRNGFSVNQFPYVQPPYAPDRNPVPMKLLSAGGAVSEDQFVAIRNQLYRNVYGQRI